MQNESPMNQKVNICVACAHGNASNRKSFPLVCPKLNMPCMAIEPRMVMNQPTTLIEATQKNNGRVPMTFTDTKFLDTMQEGYHHLIELGFDLTKLKIY